MYFKSEDTFSISLRPLNEKYRNYDILLNFIQK